MAVKNICDLKPTTKGIQSRQIKWIIHRTSDLVRNEVLKATDELNERRRAAEGNRKDVT